MKQKILTIIMCVSVTLAIGGCGKGKQDSQPQTESITEITDESEPEESESKSETTVITESETELDESNIVKGDSVTDFLNNMNYYLKSLNHTIVEVVSEEDSNLIGYRFVENESEINKPFSVLIYVKKDMPTIIDSIAMLLSDDFGDNGQVDMDDYFEYMEYVVKSFDNEVVDAKEVLKQALANEVYNENFHTYTIREDDMTFMIVRTESSGIFNDDSKEDTEELLTYDLFMQRLTDNYLTAKGITASDAIIESEAVGYAFLYNGGKLPIYAMLKQDPATGEALSMALLAMESLDEDTMKTYSELCVSTIQAFGSMTYNDALAIVKDQNIYTETGVIKNGFTYKISKDLSLTISKQ